MSGKRSGTAARISSRYPLALYTHCASHSLNLAVVASFEEASVRNMMGVVNCLCLFLCSSQEAKQVGGSNPQHTARVESDEAERSLQDQVDPAHRCS